MDENEIKSKEESEFAYSTLIFSFILPIVAYILSYFALKDISLKGKKGKKVVLTGIIVGLTPLFLLTLFLLISNMSIIPIIGLILLSIASLGIYQFNKMMTEKYFIKGVAILFIIFFIIASSIGIASFISHFLILSPDRFLPESCSAGPEFHCVEYILFSEQRNHDANFILVLTNSVGQTIENMNVTQLQVGNTMTNLTGGNTCTLTTELNGTNDITEPHINARAGENIHLKCDFEQDVINQLGAIGSKVKIHLELQYKALGSSASRPLSIQIYTTLQK